MGKQKTKHEIKQPTRNDDRKQQDSEERKCKNCGGKWHVNGRETCPARSISCHACGKQGHFSKVCVSKNKPNNEKHKTQRMVAENVRGESDSNESTL